jgi:hypothetical protein
MFEKLISFLTFISKQDNMDEFVIHRGKPIVKDDIVAKVASIKRLIVRGNVVEAVRKIVQFRGMYTDFEFDIKMNCAKLCLDQGNKEQALAYLEEIRKKTFDKFIGEKWIAGRALTGDTDIGALDVLPKDVMRLVLPSSN